MASSLCYTKRLKLRRKIARGHNEPLSRPEHNPRLGPRFNRGHTIVFDNILVMLAFAVLLLALARRLKLPYPVLLALAGAAVAVAQVDVALHLNPEPALALFNAPVLLDAAYETSLRDLKRGSPTNSASATEGLRIRIQA